MHAETRSEYMQDAATETTTAHDPYLDQPKRQWWLVIALTFAAVMAVIDRTILSLLFDPIKNDLQFSDTQMATIFGFAFAISNVLFTLPAGFLADRINRRGLIATGSVVWSLFTSACGAVTGYWQMIFTRSGVGFSESVIHPSSWSMLRSALPEKRRGRGFAVYGMSLMGGSALGFLVGGLLIELMSSDFVRQMPFFGEIKPWRLVMYSLGLIGLPFALLMATVREPKRPATKQDESTVTETLRHIGKHWTIYIPLMVYSATLSMQSNAYGAFLASIPQRRWNIPVSDVGKTLGVLMLFAAPTGLWIAGVMMDKLSPKHGRRAPALVGIVTIFLTFITSTLTPIASSPFWFYVLITCVFVVGGCGFPIAGNLISLVTPARNMGKTSAIQLFVYGLIGMGSGPTIVGFVSDRFFPGTEGIAPAMAWCCGAFTFTSLLCMLMLLFTTKVKSTPST